MNRLEKASIEVEDGSKEQDSKFVKDLKRDRNLTKSNKSFQHKKVEPSKNLNEKIPETPPRRNKRFISAQHLKLQSFEKLQPTNDDVYADESYVDLRTPFIGLLI